MKKVMVLILALAFLTSWALAGAAMASEKKSQQESSQQEMGSSSTQQGSSMSEKQMGTSGPQREMGASGPCDPTSGSREKGCESPEFGRSGFLH